MSYSMRRREKPCLAVMMLGIAAFAIGAPIGYALLIVAISLGALIVDKVISFLRNQHQKDPKG